MDTPDTYTAFAGDTLLAAGSKLDVALAVKAKQKHQTKTTPPIVIFDDRTGRSIDLDLRGSDDEIAARLAPSSGDETKRAAGRPKLGVVAREVTLLPRHWDWLGEQPGGASVTLRKLVEAARKADEAGPGRAKQAADQFMMTMLGNQPGYEEAARALYAGDQDRFQQFSTPWPADLRDHARRLAAHAFFGKSET